MATKSSLDNLAKRSARGKRNLVLAVHVVIPLAAGEPDGASDPLL